ncbi:MAG: formyltetrahydrofolate deformylase [Azospirillaceae bacterium]
MSAATPSDPAAPGAFLLRFSCLDQPGIVAAVAVALAERGGNILESAQYGDPATGRFFMRVRFDPRRTDREGFEHALRPVFERFDMRGELVDTARRPRVLILVSKMDHCLADLLYRWRRGDLPMDLVGVQSNHEVCRRRVEGEGLPFHHRPVTPETKAESEAELLDRVAAERVDLVILARYMQILSDVASKKLYGRAINIHHSFLPGFKGANPYTRAHERGVKLIGATAHYVTEDLDEGPIIEQDVARVTHADTAADLVRVGRDVECAVLARAVKWHLEHRILINGRKTVVFS